MTDVDRRYASIIRCGAAGGAWLLNWRDDRGNFDESLAFHTKKAAVRYVINQLIDDLEVTPMYERVSSGHYRYEWNLPD